MILIAAHLLGSALATRAARGTICRPKFIRIFNLLGDIVHSEVRIQGLKEIGVSFILRLTQHLSNESADMMFDNDLPRCTHCSTPGCPRCSCAEFEFDWCTPPTCICHRASRMAYSAEGTEPEGDRRKNCPCNRASRTASPAGTSSLQDQSARYTGPGTTCPPHKASDKAYPRDSSTG